MSVSAFPRLVFSWDRLLEGYRRTGSGEDFLEAYYGGEPWLEDYRAPDWNENYHAAADASEIYDAMRPFLGDEYRRASDWVMSFFWNGTTPPREPGLVAAETFAITLSPSSVIPFVELADALDLEVMRAVYRDVVEGLDDSAWFPTFDDFLAYVRQWIKLLRAAAARGAGVVVTIA